MFVFIVCVLEVMRACRETGWKPINFAKQRNKILYLLICLPMRYYSQEDIDKANKQTDTPASNSKQ